MRRTMFKKTQNYLNKSLFILDSELSKPLLDMRMKTYLISKTPMLSLHSNAPSTLTEFASAQEKHRKSMQDCLNKIEKDISTILTESCRVSMRTFKEENRIGLSDDFYNENDPNSTTR